MMEVKDRIIEFAKKNDIDEIGFCKVDGNSFIVILEAYPVRVEEHREHSKPWGRFSISTNYEDYHNVVQKKLDKLKIYLEEEFRAKSLTYCDTSPFSDRRIAYEAGLGRIGKNSFLLNKRLGTMTYIGYLLTDLEIQENSIIDEDYCGSCELCLKACPTGAISKGRGFEKARCLSYLTQVKNVPEDLKQKLNYNLYGCDLCQKACPYNKVNESIKDWKKIVDSIFDLEKILTMNNKEFKSTIAKTSAGWRGKKQLQRNAVIILGNNTSQENVQLLNDNLTDIREDIRLEIVHSLGRIGHTQAKDSLKKQLEREENKEIRNAIQYYLGMR